MQQSLTQHIRKKYNTLYARTAKAIQNGKFITYTKAKRKALYERLHRYERRLKNWGIAVASVAALFGAPTVAKGQITFTQQTGINDPFGNPDNPFNGVDVEYNSTPTFVDIDGDGDLDAFVGEANGNINYFKNIGASTSTVFVEQIGTDNPFDGTDVDGFSAPTFVDIDGDGDLDAFVGNGGGNIIYFENTGASSNPVFVEQMGADNPFDGINIGIEIRPTFVDIDGDGDFDAFVGARSGNINYFENTGTSNSPAFSAVITNPFGLTNSGYGAAPSFVDIDGDGDFDAFVGTRSGNILYFENTGSSSRAAFSAPSTNRFGLTGVGRFSSPSFVDLDSDGDFDAFVGERYGTIKYFQNTGTSDNPIFVSKNSADVGTYSTPSFVDIDGDGDFDAFVGNRDGDILYFQNTGSSSNPVFGAPSSNPFGLSYVGDNAAPSFVDIDGDGDFDAFIGEYYGNIFYFQNTGSSSSPAFSLSNSSEPFGLSYVGYGAVPSFVDIDGDGDFDAFVGETDGNIFYFKNTGSSNSPAFSVPSSNPFGLSDVGDYAAPSFVDIDGDGDFDAFIGEYYGDIFYFENTGASSSPAFVEQTGSSNPFDGVNLGYKATPTFVDIDDDGDFDAFVGGISGTINYFENTSPIVVEPTTFVEQTGIDFPVVNPFVDVNVDGYSAPAFVDIDGDGDLDAFVGEEDGNTFFFENTGSSSSPAFSTPLTNPFGLTNVGENAKPSFVDIDGDGDLDAFIGEYDENVINYYRNIGSSSSPVFVEQTGTNNPFDGLTTGYSSAPSFVDIDGDGDFDAFVGEYYGTVSYFQNTGSSSNPIFVQQTGSSNPFDGINIDGHSSPTFVDIDGDGDFDAFIGTEDEGILYFQNTGSSTSPAFEEQTGINNPLDEIGFYFSTPTFADIDGDGDFDTFVGEEDGTIFFFENTGSNVSPDLIIRRKLYFSAPTFVDIDGDGDFDAFVGEDYGTIFFFENTGSNVSPAFKNQVDANNPLNSVDVGLFSTPTFVDIDGDGDFDAFIGEVYGTILYYQNTGSNVSPAFEEQVGANNPLNSVDVGLFSTPTFVDIDGDGDFDAFTGEDNGTIKYYQNTGSNVSPAFEEQIGGDNPLNNVALSRFSSPTFVDIDGDGDADALIGEDEGIISYFRNIGSISSPTFVKQTGKRNPFNGIDVGEESKPAFVDIDGDGDFDAFVGEEDGDINYFENTSPLSCTATAGELGNSEDTAAVELCQGTDDGIVFEQTGASANDEYAFLLVDNNGDIVANNTNGDFDLAALSVGTYTVYGLSYASDNSPAAVADYLADKTTITAIQADDADTNFCLELSNTATTGETNLLTIKPFPVISQQLSNQAICADETATFEVVANGSDLKYQWQQDGEDLDGENNASLTTSDEGEYNVLITENGCTISSDTVSLTIKPNPVITQQPSDQAICADKTATFEVTASGSDLKYQWQQDGEDLNGQNNASLTTSDEGEYNVLITQNGCTISSDTVSLTLDPNCDIPDISTLEVSYCGKELSADFEPVAGAVGYRAEITVLGRNGEVITRNIPTPPFDLKISVPERLLGTTIQVRLAAIFIDAETGEKVVGTFSESRNIVIVNCGDRNSNDLESRGAKETALTHALLSPNPASETLNLSYASLSASQVEIMVMDGTGRMVWQTKQTSSIGANQLFIPIADLPAGIYQLRLVIAEQVAVLPFVKQ